MPPAFGKVLASRLTTGMIENFIDQKQTQGLADASINRYLSALRRGFVLGQKALPPLVAQPPAITLLKEDNTREGFLEYEDYVRFRDELPPHQKLILVMGFHWGMRLGELLSLRWHQVDWQEGIVRLSKKQTKGAKARNAPLYCGDLHAFLTMAFEEPGRGETIVSFKGKPITEVKTAWDKARERAGLGNLLRHDLRRTAIRNMTRAGISMKRAMAISGHLDVNVFWRYDITDEQDTKADGLKIGAYLKTKENELRTTIGTTIEGNGPGPIRPN